MGKKKKRGKKSPTTEKGSKPVFKKLKSPQQGFELPREGMGDENPFWHGDSDREDEFKHLHGKA